MSRIFKSFKSPPRTIGFFDYYQHEFARLHLELQRIGYRMGAAISGPAKFWDDVPAGSYPSERGLELVREYADKLEEYLADIIRRHSVAYWLHTYRRIGPRLPGASAATTSIVRRTLEAAVHKYGQPRLCERISNSSDVPLEKILNGALVRDERLKALATESFKRNQLVLTDFDLNELVELYDAESLAYEIWGCGATSRVLGKGATLKVDASLPHRYKDERSTELGVLLESLDSRGHGFFTSATGTVFSKTPAAHGYVMLPVYNVSGFYADYVESAFEELANLQLQDGATINFAWVPFDIRQYFHAHQPFAAAFEAKHGVTLTSVLAVIAGLLWAASLAAIRDKRAMTQLWQRAYEGPFTSRERVLEIAREVIRFGADVLGPPADVADVEIERAVDFLTSKPADINVLLGGPMGPLLSSGPDGMFIDYAWIHSTLYNLFFDVHPTDERFKGKLLEELVHAGHSILPDGPCKLPNGLEREVDAGLAVGNSLILGECRAFGRSFGVERGDPAAIDFRNRKIRKALADADEKASLLAGMPIGKNYDLREFDQIIPIGVTPFNEFIPSLEGQYWLTKDIPRVLTPPELEDAIKAGVFNQPLPNAFPIKK